MQWNLEQLVREWGREEPEKGYNLFVDENLAVMRTLVGEAGGKRIVNYGNPSRRDEVFTLCVRLENFMEHRTGKWLGPIILTAKRDRVMPASFVKQRPQDWLYAFAYDITEAEKTGVRRRVLEL